MLTGQAVCEILAATVTPPPESRQKQGITHWSSRRLADWLGRSRNIPVSHDSITRVWRRFSVPPGNRCLLSRAGPGRGQEIDDVIWFLIDDYIAHCTARESTAASRYPMAWQYLRTLRLSA